MTHAETHGGIDLQRIIQLQDAPQPFEPGEARFWTDAHIAKQMLASHLDPDVDGASRAHATIDRSVQWIATSVGLQPGDSILDMGCGPGLYAQRLAQAGFKVTGVDFSQNSLDYAEVQASEKGLSIQYHCQDYLDLGDEARYAAVLLICGDYCPFSPEKRVKLLANVRRALLPGGRFILDVTTPLHRQVYGLKNGWHAAGQGFWKPRPYLALMEGFAYPGDLFLDQYVIIEGDGNITVYRNWFQDYTPETIRAELEAGGFEVESLWGDLEGNPYTDDSGWIGIVARRG